MRLTKYYIKDKELGIDEFNSMKYLGFCTREDRYIIYQNEILELERYKVGGATINNYIPIRGVNPIEYIIGEIEINGEFISIDEIKVD